MIYKMTKTCLNKEILPLLRVSLLFQPTVNPASRFDLEAYSKHIKIFVPHNSTDF